jgi:hypothetical protein
MMRSHTKRMLASLCLVAIALFLYPIETMKTNQMADNPQGCSYYISLQTLLTNYPLLSFDKANVQFIKKRLQAFEISVVENKNPAVAASYQQQYQTVLNQYRVSSIDQVSAREKVLAIAKSAANIIDNYYFDTRVSCVLPMYDWKQTYTRHILNFNLGGLYDGLPIQRFERILFTNDSGIHLGDFPGFFVNNQTTTLGTQFMTGMPLLTALYVLPRYQFANLGNYQGLVPWCAFWTAYVVDPNLRKIFNIAGIDVFTISENEIAKQKKAGVFKTLPRVQLIGTGEKSRFGKEFSSYRNLDSYGMAYLANDIHYANQADLLHSEKVIRRYFAKPEHHNPAAFDQATRVLYDSLMGLKSKYDVVLEADPAVVNASVGVHGKNGSVTVNGLLGPRAYFDATCPQDQCLFVFNTSAAPGWHAYVNGQAEPIYRVNYAFMGTIIPKGQSVVWFIYEPWFTLFCYFISLFSLLILALITVYATPKSRH